MIPALEHRGFGYGSGLIAPDNRKFIINIPKNASSYMVDWAVKNGWSSAVVGDACSWHRVEEMIVTLRDPLNRWISGITQYINTYILSVCGPNGPVFPSDYINARYDWSMTADQFIDSYNQVVERLIFDVVNRFDDHVWPQYEFFENVLPHVPRKYFYIDDGYDQRIGDYLKLKPIASLDRNSSLDNSNMRAIKDFFVTRLHQRPELKQRIVKAYARDYDIIEREINNK